MLYQLPPVGNPILLSGRNQDESVVESAFLPYKPRFFDSGTSALGAAVLCAVGLKKVREPEVLLPAYGCPDLVSAVLWAGAKPVLVDLEADRPWMDLDSLERKISPNTVAIIGVALLGIQERMEQLRILAERAHAVLIEDSAQVFPHESETSIWSGDLVVLSFGRGKPVSLLGGGALLYRDELFKELVPEPTEQVTAGAYQSTVFKAKTALYNLMIKPWLYWIPQGLPFLGLGETRFHALTRIGGMSRVRLNLLPANIEQYRSADLAIQKALSNMLAELALRSGSIIDLPRCCGVPETRRLLRYPVLVTAGVRDRLYEQLRRHGLGASVMYPAVLPKIDGLEARFSGEGDFPIAQMFAASLLTLPTHSGVGAGDVEKIRRAIEAVF